MSHLRVEGSVVRLSIRVLGPLQVTLDGQPVAGFESDKARGLLVYLAVEAEQRQTREKLAGLLWPDWLERSARSNLRRALANLRQVIGDDQASPPFLHISRQAIQFNSASDAWVDVSEFINLVDAGTNVRDPSRQTVDRLEKAVTLYRGEFLDGFSVADSAAFEEWISINRERTNRQMVDRLYCLANCYEGYGEYEKALQHVWRQLELNPWREKAHRQAMRLLALGGQRGAALAHYETCRRLLDEELGVEPAAETRKLCEQIRAEELKPPVSPSSSRPVDSRAKLPSSSDRLRSKRLSVSLRTALVAMLGMLLLLGIGLVTMRQGCDVLPTEAGAQLPSASPWPTPTPLVPLPVPVALYDEGCSDRRLFLEQDIQDAGGIVVKPGAEQMWIEVRCDGDQTTVKVHFPKKPAYPIEFLDDAALVLSIETEMAYGHSFIQAAVAYAVGDYPATISRLDDMFLSSPSFEVYLLRAQARLHQEDWSGAVEDYTSSLDGWPEADAARRAQAYAGRGLARILHRQLEPKSASAREDCERYAAGDFESAMMAQPDRPLWLAGRALARYQCPDSVDYDVIGDIDDAVEQTEGTGDADSAMILGTAALIHWSEVGDNAQAGIYAKDSIALVDVFPTSYFVLFNIYIDDEREKALEAYWDCWVRCPLPTQRLRLQELINQQLADFP
jgi:DNA-binding SARP family transcriptional activator